MKTPSTLIFHILFALAVVEEYTLSQNIPSFSEMPSDSRVLKGGPLRLMEKNWRESSVVALEWDLSSFSSTQGGWLTTTYVQL